MGTGAHIAHAQNTRDLVRNAHNRIMNFQLVGGGEIGTHFASRRVWHVAVPEMYFGDFSRECWMLEDDLNILEDDPKILVVGR